MYIYKNAHEFLIKQKDDIVTVDHSITAITGTATSNIKIWD